MVKSAKSLIDEEQEEEEEDEAEDYDSSSYKGESVRGDGKSSEQKASTQRSKHSETEQRRRSKINERFQILRDLIPQNDQKRDKASFLSEVIEYIQFLQEKLQMYEGACQGWSQEPTKLKPWKNHHASSESLLEHAQVTKNGSALENTAVVSNVQNSIKSDLGATGMYKELDHPPGSANPAVPFSIYAQSNIFAALGRGGRHTEPFEESVPGAENVSCQLQSQPCASECTGPNNASNVQGDLMSENRFVNLSSAYSQGILSNLTQALQSSGVDLSQASISVQIDVGKQVNSGATAVESSSQNERNQYWENQVTMKDSDQALKRLRTEKS